MAENPSNVVPDQIILLEGGSKLVPAPSSSDSGKVLSVLNSDGDIGWAEGQGGGGTVDQTYDASSTNAQSGTAVAEAINGQASCQLVEGAGIDLTESNGSLVIAATVDQTYNASSTNAQSGTAVAEAIATITPGPSYTAGAGIEITSGEEINVNYGEGLGIKSTETVAYQPVSPVATISGGTQGYTTLGQLNADIVDALKNQQYITLKSWFDVDLRVSGSVWPDRARQLVICTVDSSNNPVISGNRLVFEADIKSDLTITTTEAYWPADTSILIPLVIDTDNSNIGWSDIEANPLNYYLAVFTIAGTGAYFTYSTYGVHSVGSSAYPAAVSELEVEVPGDNSLYVTHPLPDSGTYDANKVLTVNSSGAPVWAATQIPVLHSLTCSTQNGVIQGELPAGEYLEPGLYQIFLKFSMSEYRSDYKNIAYGFQVDHYEWIPSYLLYPVGVDANGPFTSGRATFMRTGYVEVGGPDEVSGLSITFKNGASSVTGSDVLNHVSVEYMKIADLS